MSASHLPWANGVGTSIAEMASRSALMGYTSCMSTRVNPIRLFVTHAWEENDDYSRIFEYLEAPGTFYYHTTSLPHAKRPIDKESEIGRAHV